MNESSDTPDNPDKPQDYPGLRAELAELVNDFLPVADELWPRLQDHKYRWELYGYRLPDGYDKLVASDIIALLVEALKSVSVARNKLTSNRQYLWIKIFYAASSVAVVSSGRSTSVPFSNFAPARTSATRWGALTARQRDWAASISL